MDTEVMQKLVRRMAFVYDCYHDKRELLSNQGQALDGYSALAEYDDIGRCAREVCGPYELA